MGVNKGVDAQPCTCYSYLNESKFGCLNWSRLGAEFGIVNLGGVVEVVGSRGKIYSNLLSGVSLSAVLAVVPLGASAQVVIDADDTDGIVFGDIASFSNPGYSLTDLPDGDDAALETGNIAGDFNNSGEIGGGDFGALINGNLGGDFFNDGEIFSDDYGYAVHVYGDVGGNFTNEGNITTARGYIAAYIEGNIGGDFFNSGNIISGTDAGVHDYEYYGVYITGDVGGDFTNTGTIAAEYYTAAYIEGNIGGNFFNSGNILSGDILYGNPDDTDFSYYGVYIGYGVDGDFTNTGNIIAEYYTAVYVGTNIGGNFTNSGNIISGSDETDFAYYGVYIAENVDGDFTNSGNIVSNYQAAYVHGNIGGNFSNSGNLSSGYYGVYVGDDVEGNFTNTGNIESTGQIWSYQGVYVLGNIGGSFFNSGDISAGAKYYGVHVGDDVIGGFTNTGNITSPDDYFGVFISGDLTGDFVNTGNIANGDGDNYTTYIGTFVGGNITTPVDQGITTNNANISGSTVTGYIPGFVPHGTTWDALYASTTLTHDAGGQSYDTASALIGISGAITGGDTVELTTDSSATLASVLAGADGLGLASNAQTLIDQAETSGYGTLEPAEQQLVDALYRQATGLDLGGVLANYSPAGSQGALSGIVSSSQGLFDILASPPSEGAGGGGADLYAMPSSDGTERTAWIQGMGSLSSQSGTSSSSIAGFDTATFGVALGVETDNRQGLQYGLALAAARTGVDGDNIDSGITSYIPAVYARYQPSEANGWYVSGIAAANWSDFDQTRINVIDDETLDADYNGLLGSVRGEIGVDLAMGSLVVTPFVAGIYGYTDLDGYTETGGISALTVAGASDSYGLLEVGGRFSIAHDSMVTNATIGYREDFDSVDMDVGAVLDAGNQFDTSYSVDTGGAFGSLDVVYDVADNVTVTTGIGVVVGEDVTSVSGAVSVDKQF